jgi:hypothetical protein
MRAPLTLGMLGLVLCSAGCTLLTNSVGLVSYKVRETTTDFLERHRDRRWAESAWAKVRQHDRGAGFSDDYHDGFIDGFSDYLYKGGNGEPPLLPPRRYRALRYQSARGYQAVQDWFAGYRQGAAAAQQSGFRQWVTGPTSLPAEWVAGPAGAVPEVIEAPAGRLGAPVLPPGPEPPARLPAGEILPPPRKAEALPPHPLLQPAENISAESPAVAPESPPSQAAPAATTPAEIKVPWAATTPAEPLPLEVEVPAAAEPLSVGPEVEPADAPPVKPWLPAPRLPAHDAAPVEPEPVGPVVPELETPVPAARPLPLQKTTDILPLVPPAAVGSGPVVPATLAVQPAQPPSLPAQRPAGITIRSLLPAFADYQLQLRPAPWLVGSDNSR